MIPPPQKKKKEMMTDTKSLIRNDYSLMKLLTQI